MLLILPNSPLPKYATKINMCDNKCCQWVFLTIIVMKNFFFFLLMLSCEVYLCCPSICSGNDLLVHGLSRGNWQTGTSFPPADARQPSSAVPASASCLHCSPICNQGSSSYLSLHCLSARSIWGSWGCNLVRLSYGKATMKGHH